MRGKQETSEGKFEVTQSQGKFKNFPEVQPSEQTSVKAFPTGFIAFLAKEHFMCFTQNLSG